MSVNGGDSAITEPSIFEDLTTVSVFVAESVARFLVEERPDTLHERTKTSPTDIVTHMDSAAEAMARELLHDRRPRDGFLGEEGTMHTSETGITWIVDPIDGTTNYLYGLPMWAVSVAALSEGRAVAGCVCAPQLQMTAYATHGVGARWRQGGPEADLSVSDRHELHDALISTGFGYSIERRRRQARVVSELLPQVRDIRRAGAASIDLCWVAAGSVDAYYEQGLHVWDFAAGALIIEQAGGIVTTLDGGSLWGEPTGSQEWPTIIAANPGLHRNLRSAVTRYGADDLSGGLDVS